MTEMISNNLILNKYIEDDPVACARYLEVTPQETVVDFLESLPIDSGLKVMHHLNDAYLTLILSNFKDEVFSQVVERLDVNRSASILLQLTLEKRELLLKKLDNKKRKEIQELIEYPNNSAGRLMTKELMALHLDIKVKDAVHKIREYSAKGFTGLYVYVVDDNGCLVGVMNMRDMLLAEDEAQLSRVMRKNVFCVDAFMDSEEVANELTTRKFLAAPVIDQDKRLLGVVKSHQIIGEVKADAAEDIQRMFGAGGNERAFSPIWYSIKKRLPWLHVNLITAFMAASVVALFEDIISKLTILAVFLPVVAGQGGNAGAQSLAVVMRGLVMREIPINKAKKLVLKETILGAINGIVIGAVTALVAWMWLGNPYLGLVIGLGMVVNLIAAGFSGAAIPLVMKKVGLDPAQCSSIILTTITDIIGFFSFLGFAVLFQEHLI